MPGKTPTERDTEAQKNAANGIKDVEMNDDSSAAKKAAKGKAAKQGDMTVVVPPSKSSKSPEPPADADGDVAMGDENAAEVEDPVAQTISSKFIVHVGCTNRS